MTQQNLRVPACPQRASGHAWRLARDRATRECQAEACEACGLIRMTSYRTGQVISYKTADNPAGTAPGTPRQDYPIEGEDEHRSGVHELPSVALTTRFLALCQEYGAERLAVSIVAAGRSTGVPGLPHSDDWTAWDADEMRAAVDYLERKRTGR